MSKRLPLALVLASSLVACGGSADLDTKSETLGRASSAVQGGKADTSATDTFAVGVANRYGGLCSGTLIAPNLVLTARHCVIPPGGSEAVTCLDKFPKNVAPSYLYVTTDANINRAKNFYQAAEIITPTDDAFCGNDLALILLDKMIPADQAKPVTPAVQFSLSDPTKVGKQIAAIGFGVTSPSNSDSGQRRIRENIQITCVPGDNRYTCDQSITIDIDDKSEFVTEGWVCSGDSGSGAFEQSSFSKGEPVVIGTLSRGPQTADTCLAAIYSRTDAHAQLIIDAGQKAAAKGGYDAPAWVTAQNAPADPSGVTCVGDTCTDTSATDPAPAPKVITTTTSGCSASPVGPTGPTGSAGALLGLAAVALVLGRRGRRVPG